MLKNNYKPEVGEKYFIVSDYAPLPYEYEWHNDAGDKIRHQNKVFYKTEEEAKQFIKEKHA